MARPLKIGAVLPISQRSDGSMPGWPDVRDMALRAESLGFDSVWVFDHFIMHGRDGVVRGIWECWSMLSALAAVTRRVELGTLVLGAGFRNPALLAKMADTVDDITGGRLILGLGAGWHEPEYRAFGYPFDHRVSRFEEALSIITPLLRQGKVDVDGRFVQAHECELRPRGPRPNGPPILVAAFGERMLELTARHADLWNGAWYKSPTDVAEPREKVDAACRAVGRDPATLGRTAGINLSVPGGQGRGPVLDSPAAIVDLLRGYAAEGISHVQVMLDPMTEAGLEAMAPALELLDRS